MTGKKCPEIILNIHLEALLSKITFVVVTMENGITQKY
jgi:hypothetical protein